MNITLCTYTLSNGGAERVISQWANGFAERGNNVQIILLKQYHSLYSYPVNDNVKIVNISSSNSNKIINFCQTILRLRHIVKLTHPDTVISALCPVHVLFATSFLQCTIINTEHDAFERPYGINWRKEKFLKFQINKFFDKVTVLTSRDLEIAKKSFSHVYLLPNPLAIKPCNSVEKKEKIVLAVGRLDAWHCKGFDILVNSWADIFAKFPEWKLCIIGSGTSENREFLYNLATERGCEETLSILDFKQNILDHYGKASVFVLSSRYEGFGLVLIEAMSQSCACIACDYLGRQREIFGDTMCGIVCTPDDCKMLSLAMSRILSNKIERQLLAEAAFKRSESFCLDNIMKQWDYILADIKSNL